MRRLAEIMLAVLLAGGGCGRSGIDLGSELVSNAPDAGTDGAEGPADFALRSGRRAFVVHSKVTPDPSDAPPGYHPEHTFTLVLDADARVAFVGATEGGRQVAFKSSDGVTFELGQVVAFALGGRCGELLSYFSMNLTLTRDGNLAGTAKGQSRYIPPGASLQELPTVTMALAGVPDVEPPTLSFSADNDPTDPFQAFTLLASEPLPPGARAQLVSASGETFALDPLNGDTHMFRTFRSPTIMLRPGEAYRVTVDGLVDFAGNVGRKELSFVTRAAPPRIAEDGFESTKEEDLGGPELLAGPDNPVIAGARSFYVPPAEMQPEPRPTSRFTLRFAVQPGDKAIVFKYRTVDVPSAPGRGFATVFGVGAIGRSVGFQGPPDVPNTPQTPFEMPDHTKVLLGPVLDGRLFIDDDDAGEIYVGAFDGETTCKVPGPPLQGIIIDDLHVE